MVSEAKGIWICTTKRPRVKRAGGKGYLIDATRSSLVDFAWADAFITRPGSDIRGALDRISHARILQRCSHPQESGQIPKQTMKRCLLHHQTTIIHFVKAAGTEIPPPGS